MNGGGVYNTPGYGIPWSGVFTNGIQRNVARIEQPLTLEFNMTLGMSTENLAVQNGSFAFYFSLFQGATEYGGSWIDSLTRIPFPQQPVTNLWVSLGWARAGDATNNQQGLFRFSPIIYFLILLPGLDGSSSQFAIGADHWMTVVP